MLRAKIPGHRVVLVDPFSVVKSTYKNLPNHIDCDSHGFNPLATLDCQSLRFVDDAKSLAVALIKTEGRATNIGLKRRKLLSKA